MTSQPTGDVLIAQLPRAGDRWGQGNFKLSIFKDFFHLDPDLKQSIVLHPIDAAGVVLDPEPRESVSVDSKNFRFEIGLAKGHTYPDEGPPIAVFRPLGVREFRYRLVFPSEPIYAALSAFAYAHRNGPEREMIRFVIPYSSLLAAVPSVTM